MRTPQGCCLSPKLFTLYTYDCISNQDNNVVIKYTDGTTILGLIRDGDESSYRDLVQKTTVYGNDNELWTLGDEPQLVPIFLPLTPYIPNTVRGKCRASAGTSIAQLMLSFSGWIQATT